MLLNPRPPPSTLFPYTTLFRSLADDVLQEVPHLGALLLHHLLGRLDGGDQPFLLQLAVDEGLEQLQDRKSTRLNPSHLVISYAVFCLKKKINAIKIRNRDSEEE